MPTASVRVAMLSLWFYDLDGNKLEFCRVLKKG